MPIRVAAHFVSSDTDLGGGSVNQFLLELCIMDWVREIVLGQVIDLYRRICGV